MSEEVEARIREAIERHGPITFAEFMEHALYGPGGFYERPPVGEHGHFITSPHVHYVFGTLLAKALQSFWTGAGQPVPFRLIEAGAGDGTLAGRLLTELEPPIEYVAIDRSPGARAALAKLQVRVAPSLEMIESHSAGCIFANAQVASIRCSGSVEFAAVTTCVVYAVSLTVDGIAGIGSKRSSVHWPPSMPA